MDGFTPFSLRCKAFPTVNSEISLALRSILAAAVLGTPLIAWAAPSVGADTKVDRISIGIGGCSRSAAGRRSRSTWALGRRPACGLKSKRRIPEGSVVTYQSEPLELQQNGPNVLSVLFKMGGLAGTIHVRVVADGRVLFSRQLRVCGAGCRLGPAAAPIGLSNRTCAFSCFRSIRGRPRWFTAFGRHCEFVGGARRPRDAAGHRGRRYRLRRLAADEFRCVRVVGRDSARRNRRPGSRP